MKPAGGSTRMKASDFHPYILEIFDGYVHGKMTKREFMREAGKFAAAQSPQLANGCLLQPLSGSDAKERHLDEQQRQQHRLDYVQGCARYPRRELSKYPARVPKVSTKPT